MLANKGEPEEKNQPKPEDYGYRNIPGTPSPAPLERPPFTLKEIRDSIPPHCFNRSTLKSLGYLIANVLICLCLFYSSLFISYFPNYISVLLWPAYWYVQGVYMFGLWIIGHECGHQSLSDYQLFNDTVGLVVHSFLIVPFHSWKITHHRHHLHTANCDHDEVFPPKSRDSLEQSTRSSKYLNNKIMLAVDGTPVHNLLSLLVLFPLGFMPFYLIFNMIGPAKYDKKNANHFSPSSVLFSPKQRNQVVLSNLGVFAVILGFLWIYMNYGFTPILFYYLIPLLVVNTYLAVVTFLQHTDTFVPHLRDEEWSWLRGALCTVDRSFGQWFDGASHHITDTHVCHHLFSSMPFYHAQEATAAMQKVLGPYYLKDETPVWKALWRTFTHCKFVEDNQPIVFYKKSLK